MTQTLCGKNITHHNNLLGSNNESIKGISLEIKNLKIKIINTIILPLVSKQWGELYDNRFFMEDLKIKLDYYYKLYKIEDLLLYKNIIGAFELILNEHKQLEDLEKRMFKGDDFTSIVYKTTMIRLKPEYELYDAIFGKPKREKNQVYNDQIVLFIRNALGKSHMTFQKIKEQVLLEFNT